MYIEEKLRVSGSQIVGSINHTISKGNVFVVSDILGLELSKEKELTLKQVEQLQEEVRIITEKMHSTRLQTEEYKL